MPPLLAAAKANDAAKVQQLLAEGAAPNQTSGPAGGTALHYAAVGGRPAIISALLAICADPNARARLDRSTPLMVAANENRAEAAKLLIAAGADLEAAMPASGAT